MPAIRALASSAILLLLTAACGTLIPTPDDFPQPPWTPIVEFPTPAFPTTSVPRPRLKPMLPSDMDDARTFFLITKVAITAGDSGQIAGSVLYPIEVKVNGQPRTIASEAQLEDNYEAIFHTAFMETIMAAEEGQLLMMPSGIQAAGGALWFNLFCQDSACLEGEFRITEINN